jgi:hypothetical protein
VLAEVGEEALDTVVHAERAGGERELRVDRWLVGRADPCKCRKSFIACAYG